MWPVQKVFSRELSPVCSTDTLHSPVVCFLPRLANLPQQSDISGVGEAAAEHGENETVLFLRPSSQGCSLFPIAPRRTQRHGQLQEHGQLMSADRYRRYISEVEMNR